VRARRIKDVILNCLYHSPEKILGVVIDAKFYDFVISWSQDSS
jgi:hypothetical protein